MIGMRWKVKSIPALQHLVQNLCLGTLLGQAPSAPAPSFSALAAGGAVAAAAVAAGRSGWYCDVVMLARVVQTLLCRHVRSNDGQDREQHCA